MLAGLLLAQETVSAQERSVRIPLLVDGRSQSGQAEWRYSVSDPPINWADTAFDDTDWSPGLGGFGTGTVLNGQIRTSWEPGSIWIRKAFTLPDVDIQSLVMSLHHDEDVEVFLNGTPVFQESGWKDAYSEFYLDDAHKSLLRPGRNVLALACRNTDGPGYLDAGLWVDAAMHATPLVGDARTFPAEWAYVTADPGAEWFQPGFDASAWGTGRAGFGAGDIYGPATPWTDSDIWMRTAFKVDAAASMYELSFMHDDDLEVYVNGTLVARNAGFTSGYEDRIEASLADLIKPGENILAAHCANTGTGPQFVDVGLRALDKPTPVKIPGRKAASRNPAAPLLRAARGGVDVTGLARGIAGRLTVTALDGRVLARVSGGSGAGYLSLPVTLGTGVFRYHWDSPRGARAGTLLSLP